MIHMHQVAGVGLFLIKWLLLIEGKRKNNNAVTTLMPPIVTYDRLGNCFVSSVHLRGQCVRYQQCYSAVQNWVYLQQIPYSCYYNAYDNFVCCPEFYIHLRKSTHTSQAKNAPPQRHYPLLMHTNWPRISPNPSHQEQRKSQQECFSLYSGQPEQRRHHRSKRAANDPSISTKYNEDETASSPAQEERIVKQHMPETFVVGGVATNRNEFPHMCALGWRSTSSKSSSITYNCGCVLIAPKYALTAAHCATLGGDSPSVVRLGGVDLDDLHAKLIKIQRITQHPAYNPQLAYNDIAVVKLKKKSRVTPACLWPTEEVPQEVLTAIGYGQTQFAGPSSNTLLKVFLNLMSNEDCNTYHKPENKLVHGIAAGQICAGQPSGKMDTCQGDSGGPLLMNIAKYNAMIPYIVGLTSYGEGCASGMPGVYTRISYYIDWIEDEVWK